MRIIAVLLLLIDVSSAHAEKLYSPVRIRQATGICTDFNSFKIRDGLAKQNRTELLSSVNTVGSYSGECSNVPEGQWLFLDGWNESFVCLRPRLGAECAWVRRSAIGEVAEIFPGRTIQQGNKGVTCQNWAQAVQKSKAIDAENDARYRDVTPNNFGESLAKGALATVIGTFTGAPAYDQVQHANRCDIWFAHAAEAARRLTAYRACPALGDSQQEQANYNSLLKLANDSCTPH